ncbi:hypothetical protein GGR50DRAFT_637581 [Xylaria sp. CBS 124048]|nr:hypothetical protein GGR50DRAFT_637581 [Xylaria sp. CBS 124048]
MGKTPGGQPRILHPLLSSSPLLSSLAIERRWMGRRVEFALTCCIAMPYDDAVMFPQYRAYIIYDGDARPPGSWWWWWWWWCWLLFGFWYRKAIVGGFFGGGRERERGGESGRLGRRRRDRNILDRFRRSPILLSFFLSFFTYLSSSSSPVCCALHGK